MLQVGSVATVVTPQQAQEAQPGDSEEPQTDPGNLISPDPRRGPSNPLSPRAKADKQTAHPLPSTKPVPIPSLTKEGQVPQAVAVTASAEGTALPVVGSPEQYLLRAKHMPPRPGNKPLSLHLNALFPLRFIL